MTTYPIAKLSPNALARVKKEVAAYLAEDRGNLPPQDPDEVLADFIDYTIREQNRRRKLGVAKRVQRTFDRRLANTLGLAIPPELGEWNHKSQSMLCKLKGLPEDGWSLLRIPALLPGELTALRDDLIKALPLTGRSQFCVDAREILGPHYKVDKIVIGHAMQRAMKRRGARVDLASVFAPYLSTATRRIDVMNTLAGRMNELSGYPAWGADFESTQRSEKGCVTLRFNLAAAPDWCEAWRSGMDDSGKPILEESILNYGFYMSVDEGGGGEIIGQSITLWRDNEKDLSQVVDDLSADPLKGDLRRSFARIARLSFADEAINVTGRSDGLTQEHILRLKKTVGYRAISLGEVLRHHELPDESREFICSCIPALRPTV